MAVRPGRGSTCHAGDWTHNGESAKAKRRRKNVSASTSTDGWRPFFVTASDTSTHRSVSSDRGRATQAPWSGRHLLDSEPPSYGEHSRYGDGSPALSSETLHVLPGGQLAATLGSQTRLVLAQLGSHLIPELYRQHSSPPAQSLALAHWIGVPAQKPRDGTHPYAGTPASSRV